MKSLMTIQSLEQVRAISDPLRIAIITQLVKGEYTGKQLGTELGLAASKVHYHLKELEHHQFVEVVRTEEKNGILQKFYRAVAYDFRFSDDLLPSVQEDTMFAQESMINQLRLAISHVQEAPKESFRSFADEEDRPPLLHMLGEVRAPRQAIKTWLNKYRILMKELDEIETAHVAAIEAGEIEDPQEVFFLANIAFMTDSRLFQSDEDEQDDV
ncbi:MAG TPA: winged helix-turn-helix domain-containing protein [Bacilli bacterium]|nr:winged helix-turn-helix domain-containing protein [Bacilli bacterium]